MKKLILSSALIVAGCFLASAQNNHTPAKPATISQSTEEAVPAGEVKKPEVAVSDESAPKKACCSHDTKSSSTKSVSHKHGKKTCKVKCCTKKES